MTAVMTLLRTRKCDDEASQVVSRTIDVTGPPVVGATHTTCIMTARTPLHGILAVAHVALASCAWTNDMRPLSSTFEPAGISLHHLATLHVAYNRTNDVPFVLHGADIAPVINQDSGYLERVPDVRWEAQEGGHNTDILMFIDLGPVANKKAFFPFVHSVWGQCRDSLASCGMTIKGYLPPGNIETIPNRYTWVLFRRAGRQASTNATLVLAGKAYKPGELRVKRAIKLPGFSLRRMIQENVGLKAISCNFLFVRGRGGRTRARRKQLRG